MTNFEHWKFGNFAEVFYISSLNHCLFITSIDLLFNVAILVVQFLRVGKEDGIPGKKILNSVEELLRYLDWFRKACILALY
jgi:hypothetical protein